MCRFEGRVRTWESSTSRQNRTGGSFNVSKKSKEIKKEGKGNEKEASASAANEDDEMK